MKTKLLLITLISIGIYSCKKDEVNPCTNPTPVDYSHLENNYLCDATNEMSYIQGHNTNWDIVLTTWVENDTLKVLNYEFPITSQSQSVFTLLDTFFSASTTLTFTNNFQDIELIWDAPSFNSGPDYMRTFIGSETSLLETIAPHPYQSDIEATYIMNVTKINNFTSLDTSYVDTLVVTMTSTTGFNIDGQTILYGDSHSRYYRNLWDGNTEDVSILRWHRNMDSLRIETLDYNGMWLTSTLTDSVQSIYYGVKL